MSDDPPTPGGRVNGGRRRLLVVGSVLVVAALLAGALYWDLVASKPSQSGSSSNDGLQVTSFSASPSIVREFQLVSFSLHVSGGTGSYLVAYQGMPYGCPSRGALGYACSPQQIGNFTVIASVNDTAGHTAQATTHLEVTPNPTIWINMSNPAHASHYGPTWAFNTTLSVTASGATNQVKLDLFNWSGPSPAAGTTPVGCAAGGPFSGCVAPASGWYGVLLSASGGVLAIFPNATGGFSPGTVRISSGQTLALVAGTNNLATYDGLTLLATTGNSVRANTIGL